MARLNELAYAADDDRLDRDALLAQMQGVDAPPTGAQTKGFMGAMANKLATRSPAAGAALGRPGTPGNSNTGVSGVVAPFAAPPLNEGGPQQDGAAPYMPQILPEGAPKPTLDTSAPDTSTWNTDGYARPGYTAKAGLPSLGSGWDEAKWKDPNHQTPKYVFGRILQEASGGTGVLRDPAQREQAVSNILKAYPGAKFDGKQKITMPDGGVIDIFHGADAGHYGAAFQVEPGTGKDASGRPIDTSGGMRAAGVPLGVQDIGGIAGQVPSDMGAYERLQQRLKSILGGDEVFEREALLSLMEQ